MKFLIKQLIGALATPLAIALMIAIAAALCRFRGRRRAAAWMFGVAAAIVYFGALGPVGDALLAPLEHRYPPLSDDKPVADISAIVVLGSAYTPRDGIPVTGALDEDGLARVVEGVRLARRFPSVRLVVSGGAPNGVTPSALGYARLARELGVDDASLVVLDKSLDTSDEARAVAKLLGETPFILVTSASHMPRAVRLMERAGTRPIPAPTGQRACIAPTSLWRTLLPSSSGLRKTDRALHEYLGLASMFLGAD